VQGKSKIKKTKHNQASENEKKFTRTEIERISQSCQVE
jgi:hypothetical protein